VSPEVLGQLLPIVVLVLLLFLLVIRPARRRAQKVSKLQEALSVGDEVMLTSGIFGTVTTVAGDRVHVRVADGVELTCHRGAIAEIVRDVPADETSEELPEASETSDTSADTDTDDNTDDETHDASSRGAN
jgi:preprotein translocase subunit YajC